jgi:uncharacterized protein (DUF2147 family)
MMHAAPEPVVSPWALHNRPLCQGWLIVALLLLLLPTLTAARAAAPEGVWRIGETAIQTYACNGLLCGRIVWLRHWRDAAGQLARDAHNPNPTLRQRPLCGMVVLWDLRPDGPGRWTGGWLYDPENGHTYHVNAHLQSPDTFVARIYEGVPLLGETKSLHRIQPHSSPGWC